MLFYALPCRKPPNTGFLATRPNYVNLYALKSGIIPSHLTFEYDKDTVLTAKSDSDFMFYLQGYQGLIIDKSLVY